MFYVATFLFSLHCIISPFHAAAAAISEEAPKARATRLASELFDRCATTSWLASDDPEDLEALQRNLAILGCSKREIDELATRIPYRADDLAEAAERLTALITAGQERIRSAAPAEKRQMREAGRSLRIHIHVTYTDDSYQTQLATNLGKLDADEQDAYLTHIRATLGNEYSYKALIGVLHTFRVPPHKPKVVSASKAAASGGASAAAPGDGKDSKEDEDEEADSDGGDDSD